MRPGGVISEYSRLTLVIMSDVEHVPVLYQEILTFMQPRAGGCYIDGTVGGGGHAQGILEGSAPDGRLLAFDRDPAALDFARKRLELFQERLTLIQTSYAEMVALAPSYGFSEVDGVLLDLGLSSRQLADDSRGFSFRLKGPLDMRFSPDDGETAADLLNTRTEGEIAEILWWYGEVKQSRKIAAAIVNQRPLRTTDELVAIVVQTLRWTGRGRIHPATQVFQALRIAVNDELGELERGLRGALDLLVPGGRLAVISFHSLEDRLVKLFIRDHSKDCVCPPEQPICTCSARADLRPVTRKVVKPSADEIDQNPRSRSARLRVAEKLTGG